MNDEQPDASPPRGARWAPVRRFARIAALAYVSLAAMMYVFQTSLIFPGGGPVAGTPDVPYEDISAAVGNETTHGWFIPREDARGVVLLSHGNGENVQSALAQARTFLDLGFSVLVYDYGGYGLSTGAPSEQRCYADIRAMWEWLTKTKGFQPNDIVLFGRSLGGGVATQLATETEPAALILESTFTSVADVARKSYWFLPLDLLVRHRFDNLAKIGRVAAPILVVHSPDDTLIPIAHGRRLFDAATARKTFLEIRGGHNDGYAASADVYGPGLAAFLDGVFPR